MASIVEEEEQRDETQSTSWQVRYIREWKMMGNFGPWTIIESIRYKPYLLKIFNNDHVSIPYECNNILSRATLVMML